MALAYFELSPDIESITRSLPGGNGPVELSRVESCLKAHKVECHLRSMSLEECQTFGAPVIAVLKTRDPKIFHFVFLAGWRGDAALMLDSPSGLVRLGQKKIAPFWPGTVLAFGAAEIAGHKQDNSARWFVSTINFLACGFLMRRREVAKNLVPAIMLSCGILFNSGCQIAATPGAHAAKNHENQTRFIKDGVELELDPGDTVRTIAEVENGDSVARGIFKLKNIGKKEIHFTGIEKECGCLAATIEPMNLLPGEQASLPFQIRTAGYGEKTVRLQATFSGGAIPLIVLALPNKSIPALLSAKNIPVGEISKGSRRRVEFVTVEEYSLPLWISDVQIGNPEVELGDPKLDTTQSIDNKLQRFYSFTMWPTAPLGDFRVPAKLLGKHGVQIAELNLVGSIIAPVEIVPSILSFAAGTDAKSHQSKQATIRYLGERPKVQLVVPMTDGKFDMMIVEQIAGKEWLLSVKRSTINAGELSNVSSIKLILKEDGREEPVFVRVFVQSKSSETSK